ncbi:MAG: bile acid:sodium symporter family protein [Acutalibacteraceae bacterium]|nr:bile acid:sodium symporter family protein [Bacillota bacterium]
MLNRFNHFIEKWMFLVTPCCLALGVLFPSVAGLGVPYVPLVFAFMTFTGGLKSGFRDIAEVFRKPLLLLLILVALHIVLPAAAFGLGHFLFPENMNIITGMVLEFTVPAAVVGLMWVSIYQGYSPLSLSLVILDTLLAPFVIPLTLHVLVGSDVEIDTTQMMLELLFMIALPALIAMLLNQFTKGRVKETWPSRLAPFSKLCLIFVVTSNSSQVAPYIRHMTAERFLVAACILLLAASGYAIGWLFAFLFRQNHSVTVSMVYGAGMRNISAGAVIASAYFPPEVVFPVMIGTLFQQILAALFGMLVSRKQRKTSVSPSV